MMNTRRDLREKDYNGKMCRNVADIFSPKRKRLDEEEQQLCEDVQDTGSTELHLLNEHINDILSNYDIPVAENKENKNMIEAPNDLYDENIDDGGKTK